MRFLRVFTSCVASILLATACAAPPEGDVAESEAAASDLRAYAGVYTLLSNGLVGEVRVYRELTIREDGSFEGAFTDDPRCTIAQICSTTSFAGQLVRSQQGTIELVAPGTLQDGHYPTLVALYPRDRAEIVYARAGATGSAARPRVGMSVAPLAPRETEFPVGRDVLGRGTYYAGSFANPDQWTPSGGCGLRFRFTRIDADTYDAWFSMDPPTYPAITGGVRLARSGANSFGDVQNAQQFYPNRAWSADLRFTKTAAGAWSFVLEYESSQGGVTYPDGQTRPHRVRLKCDGHLRG